MTTRGSTLVCLVSKWVLILHSENQMEEPVGSAALPDVEGGGGAGAEGKAAAGSSRWLSCWSGGVRSAPKGEDPRRAASRGAAKATGPAKLESATLTRQSRGNMLA